MRGARALALIPIRRPRLSLSRSIHSSATLWTLGTTACLALGATSAAAHGFGQRYDLPLPLPLYLFGAAAVVALSFVVFSLFVRGAPPAQAHRQVDLLATRFGRLIARPGVIAVIRLLGIALFALTILAGLIGDQNPYRNIAPTMVWIIFWVGLVYASVLFGEVWALLNPWRTLFDAVGWVLAPGRLAYPQWLGHWPAC